MLRFALIFLWLSLISYANAGAPTPTSKTSTAFATDLEDIAKLEKREDVLAFWQTRGWYAVPTKYDELVTMGAQIPDPKLYPFIERYEVHIWFESGTHDGFLKVYVDKNGRVIYRAIEIVNATPMTEPNKALVPTTTAVTPAADAPVAPAAVAAHL